MVSDKERFGAGVWVDSDWDIDVGESGGTRIARGIEAFERDMAWHLHQRLSDMTLGNRMTAELASDVEIEVRDVISEHFEDQISAIEAIRITEANGDNTVSIEMIVNAADEEHELVFTE